ncbi:MAG: helix-turn-helix domain-containing protein [Clostridia bacterium]|nr:helix-turn-helix domain-containing protein [Clostridia bacterium]
MCERFWQELDSSDYCLTNIAAYRVHNPTSNIFCTPPEGRRGCALTFVTEGGYHYRSNDGREFDCTRGDVSFLPAGARYRHETITAPSRMLVIYFTICYPEGSPIGWEHPDIQHIVCSDPHRTGRLFHAVCDSFFSLLCPRSEVKGALHRLIGELARGGDRVRLTEAELARLDPALTYLSSEPSSGVTVAELAARCYLSEYAFRELFKKYAGQPPKTYLIERRVERVEQMFQSTDISVTDAALACGFEDPSYFFKVYKRLRGHSPGN